MPIISSMAATPRFHTLPRGIRQGAALSYPRSIMNELLSNAEMAQADQLAIAGGVAGIDLMEHAGPAVAELRLRRHPTGSRVVVVAGPGNNGGDGFVAARLLAERGYRRTGGARGRVGSAQGRCGACAAERPVDRRHPSGLAGRPRRNRRHYRCRVRRRARPAGGGCGARPDRKHECAARAGDRRRFAERHQRHVGRGDGRRGEGRTYSHILSARNPDTFSCPGRLHCGTISVADIGIPASVLASIAPKTFENGPALWRASFPVPRHEGHKYDRGHAVVVSGPSWSTGAARLAARGALRAGAGLVTIASPREALAVNAAASLAVMVRPVDGAAELAGFLADRRLNALAIGPGVGVGEATCELVLAALSGDRAVVLDADAITSFAEKPERLAEALRGSPGSGHATDAARGRIFALFRCIRCTN